MAYIYDNIYKLYYKLYLYIILNIYILILLYNNYILNKRWLILIILLW